MGSVHGLVDYRLDEMRLPGQVDIMDSMTHASSVRDVNANLQVKAKMDTPDDVFAVCPIWPNDIDHDLGLGDSCLDGRVIPNVYDKKPNFITKL